MGKLTTSLIDTFFPKPSPHCYCETYNEKPELRKELGLQEGYCGTCDILVNGKRCGKPGHFHDGPGPVGYGYCEEHPPGRSIYFGAFFLLAVFLVLFGFFIKAFLERV